MGSSLNGAEPSELCGHAVIDSLQVSSYNTTKPYVKRIIAFIMYKYSQQWRTTPAARGAIERLAYMKIQYLLWQREEYNPQSQATLNITPPGESSQYGDGYICYYVDHIIYDV